VGNPHRSRDNFRFVIANTTIISEHLWPAQFLTRRIVFLTYCGVRNLILLSFQEQPSQAERDDD
jgi:hypothetical protein